jgi:RNA polymerase sigma factor (TIGR02999 family)
MAFLPPAGCGKRGTRFAPQAGFDIIIYTTRAASCPRIEKDFGMGEAPEGEITSLLVRWQDGEADALEALIPLVYQDLRRVAKRYLAHERPGHTLQSTALVNEVYLRLVPAQHAEWRNRTHFFALAAKIMRQILVDHARGRVSEKRGGGAICLSLEAAEEVPLPSTVDVLALDDALNRLEELDEQQCRVVELKFFAGLSNEDTATALNTSVSTVKRDWATARAWLLRELAG